MVVNARFFNRIFYIQRYYDYVDNVRFWRFWILGFYFNTRPKNEK